MQKFAYNLLFMSLRILPSTRQYIVLKTEHFYGCLSREEERSGRERRRPHRGGAHTFTVTGAVQFSFRLCNAPRQSGRAYQSLVKDRRL